MNIDIDTLIEVLEASISRNGEKPLTNRWLLNIIKQVRNSQELEEEWEDRTNMAADYWAEDWGDKD